MSKIKSSTIYLLFEQTVKLYPEEICLIYENKSLTYNQVYNKVSKVHLDILQYAKNDKIIGVSTTRSIDQIINVLAILKAGKAYLPIDFAYPKNRIKSIIKNSNINVCLSSKQDAIAVVDSGLFLISEEDFKGSNRSMPQDLIANNAAYILYTSGSTGEPKGVCMGQLASKNLINWQNENSVATKNTRTLQFAPLNFDVSFQEIMTTLSTGGTLVLINEALRLDMVALLSLIEKQAVNRLFLPFVALQALCEAAISTRQFPTSLKEIMTAGEQLKITPIISEFFSITVGCSLYNQYGPTECHVVSQLKLEGDTASWSELPSIGKAISNTSIIILDENMQSIKNGGIGELWVYGQCLAEGYIGNENLTKEKFKFLEIPKLGITRIYRTGDLARFLPDGNLEFLGRNDDQVKISGHRIELAEIELTLNKLPKIQQAVVLVNNYIPDQPQLVAYLQSSSQTLEISDFRRQVEKMLPEYMLPSHYVWLQEFPRTSSGKIDKKALPLPQYHRSSSGPLYKKPITTIQKNLANTFSTILRIPKIGVDDNFFEIGGTSLLAQKAVANMQQRFGYKVPITKLYQFPRISELSNYLDTATTSIKTQGNAKIKSTNSSGDVAIIAMTGRFPGANSVNELWKILKEGKETISFFSPDELESCISESLRNDPLYIRARGIVPSVKNFDAAFFGLNPKTAEVMDPQQRLFLEIAWEALEQSGHLPKHYNGNIGVYAGTGMNSYYINNVLPNKEILDRVGSFQASTLNEKDYISSRTSYHLNLNGPAVSVHSACSTSLLAISEAVEAIRNGQCDVALAGGSSITAPIYSGHLYQEGSMLSPNGHSRPFDKEGKGTVFSDGAGVILLKSLAEAEKDGDFIYGLIKGVGINNDGGNKGSFTAPSANGQAGAISRALVDAQLDPSTISYIEAHGTATPIGDPIEIEGLKMAFGEQENNGYCAIGSIKSNIGHLTAASGVAGLIKTILSINHKQIPPSLGYSAANPSIDFQNSPFFVNQKLRDWNVDGPLRAGISSFGVGGTNVHIVVEEYSKKRESLSIKRPFQLLAWSAKTENSLRGYSNALANYLDENSYVPLEDISYSLNTTRDLFNHRQFIITDTHRDASQGITNQTNKYGKSNVLTVSPEEVVFLFPGQGAQYLQMGRSLYDGEKVFREAVDTCSEILLGYLELDIRRVIYPDDEFADAKEKLKDTRYTQPALFAIEYALSQLWISWGIKPTIVCGHSVGEFVGAHLAGVFSLEDALHLIANRGRLISELPKGSMISISLEANRLNGLLPDTISIAAINSEKSCVVSGPDNAIEDFTQVLKNKDIPYVRLSTSHAFHSAMMDPILETFTKEVEKIQLNSPILPIVSTATGKYLTEAQATDPEYWKNHLRSTVRFSDAMDTILELTNPVILEVGPGRALANLVLQTKRIDSTLVLSSLPIPRNNEGSYPLLLDVLGKLWLAGLEPDWLSFYAGQGRIKVLLPAYVFDRKPCWIDPLGSKLKITPSQTVSELEKVPLDKLENIKRPTLIQNIIEIIFQTSGIDLEEKEMSNSFLEIGLDSLVLTQIAHNFKKEFNIPVSFRQLNEELFTPELLLKYLKEKLPTEVYTETLQKEVKLSESLQSPFKSNHIEVESSTINLIEQQLKVLTKQIELLKNQNRQDEVNLSQKPRETYNSEPEVLSDIDENKEIFKRSKAFEILKNSDGKSSSTSLNTPPILGAKLGRDEIGNPAWFLADLNVKGKYIKIDLLN